MGKAKPISLEFRAALSIRKVTGFVMCEGCNRSYENSHIGAEVAQIGGKTIILNCECNAAAAYESFIWTHRGLIGAYLLIRSNKELQEAEAALPNLRSSRNAASLLADSLEAFSKLEICRHGRKLITEEHESENKSNQG